MVNCRFFNHSPIFTNAKPAKTLKLSRNRFIVRALKKALSAEDEWSPEFLQALQHADRGDAETVDAMLEAIQRRRSSKKGVKL